MPTREPGKHPATRTFQAIRIRVNNELEEIEAALNGTLTALAPAGRLCAISFHSLEDAIVKGFIQKHSKEDPIYAGLPQVPVHARPKLKRIGRAVHATPAEDCGECAIAQRHHAGGGEVVLMHSLSRWSMPFLWCLLLASAVAVVWSTHETRSLFIQLQSLHADRDALDIEWGQLKIEQSAWASHGRVEQTARAGLKMVIPRPEDVRLVKPDA